MKIDAMLCDYAQVHAGKLFVSGAAVNLMGTSSRQGPHGINVYVAVLITVPWEATGAPHRMRVTLDSAGGNRIALADPPPGESLSVADHGAFLVDFSVARAPQMQTGEDALVAVALPLAVGVPTLGGYSLALAIDGVELNRLGFRVALIEPAG